jgi:hypothetical protein
MVRRKIFKIATGLIIVMACATIIALASFGMISDLAVNPILISFSNADQRSLDLAIDIENSFPAEAVIVRRHDYRPDLTVTLINSAVNQLSVDEQIAQAAEIARIASKNGIVNFSRIQIVFIERTTFLGVPLNSRNSYLFRGSNLLPE